MNVYEISYQDALDGKYQKPFRHDPLSSFFDRMGARCNRHYGDPNLNLGADHLQNLVDLIYSGRRHGIDEIQIVLDHAVCKEEVTTHFYTMEWLPEVKANLDASSNPPRLILEFIHGLNTLSYVRGPHDGKDVHEMSEEEIDEMLEEINNTLDDEGSSHTPLMSLGNVIASNTPRRSIKLPDWIKEKYAISKDNEDPTKKLADSLAGLNEIFGKKK